MKTVQKLLSVASEQKGAHVDFSDSQSGRLCEDYGDFFASITGRSCPRILVRIHCYSDHIDSYRPPNLRNDDRQDSVWQIIDGNHIIFEDYATFFTVPACSTYHP